MKSSRRWLMKMWNMLLELSPRVQDEYSYILYRKAYDEDNSPY